VRRRNGISKTRRFMVADLLSRARLQIVLLAFKYQGLDIYAVVQSKRQLRYEVGLLLDWTIGVSTTSTLTGKPAGRPYAGQRRNHAVAALVGIAS